MPSLIGQLRYAETSEWPSDRRERRSDLAPEQPRIAFLVGGDTGLDREQLARTAPSRSTHARRALGVVGETENCLAERGRMTRRNDVAGDAVEDRLGVAAHVRHDHRQARRHGLDDGVREPLLMRGEKSDVGGPEQGGDIGARAEKADAAGNPLPARLALDLSPP